VNKYRWREGSLKGPPTSTRSPRRRSVSTIRGDCTAPYRLSGHAQNLLETKRSSGYIPGTHDAYYLENPKTYLVSLDVEF